MTQRRHCSARSLHGTTLRIGSRSYSQTSVFPFFDASGRVQRFMLILPHSPAILDLAARPGAVTRHWWGLQIAAGLEPRSLGDQAGELGRLWHYDPWWVLAKPRFSDHPAKAALKATNIVDRLGRATFDLLYSPDLSRITHLRWLSWRPPWIHHSPFTADLLPPAISRRDAVQPSTGWRLNPSWMAKNWPRQRG